MHLVDFIKFENSLKNGFIDHSNKIVLYTDHQILKGITNINQKEVIKLIMLLV